jgi:signal transduction histidine kinase/CheY-like chemotaxis protein
MTAYLRNNVFSGMVMTALAVLLAAAIATAVLGERAAKAQLAREAGAQAELLASAVSGALAFDDNAAARDYVAAVQTNPNVLAAAVYDSEDNLVASFARPGEVIPEKATARGRTTHFQDGYLYVVRPVVEGGQTLGTARLRLMDTPPAERFSRYAGLLLILALAALTVLVFAIAQTALRRANRRLAESNLQLTRQIAEREKAEEALRQSQKMEALGRLTGGIAHDFNNLLMVASSGVDLLDRTEDPKRRRMLSDGIRQAVDRGAALTRQLLVFSRRSPLRTEVLDLGERVRGLRFLLERSLREDIQVKLTAPEGLWPVECDPAELELALMNLAVNARDAMPNGGVLTVSAENVEGHHSGRDVVCLTVSDTGVGMPEAVRSRIFEPFFTTKEVGRGTGLGLSQVYGFIQASGGDVTVSSEEGRGTTFTLCLPRSHAELGTSTEAPPPPAPADPKQPRQGRLLLVEDDDAVAASVGHMLRDLGYTYVRRDRAADALDLVLTGEAFDLMLSDMIMPGDMDGLALAEAVSSHRPDLPVVLMTGYSEAAATAAASSFRLLRKPYRIDDLASTLDAALAGRKVAAPSRKAAT